MENFKTTTFIVPSGAEYEIREQNGEDEGVLSNQADAQKLMNITKFLAGIIVHSSVTGGACSVKQVLEIPLLDRYAIIFQSRIFSLGNTLEFEYNWGKLPNGNDDKVLYEQDLNEFLFSDYSKVPTEEELYDLAELFKVFGDSTRIKILYVLVESDMSVGDIAQALNMTQSSISHQLRVLKQSRLVRFRREGKNIVYSLADDHVHTIMSQGLEHLEE